MSQSSSHIKTEVLFQSRWVLNNGELVGKFKRSISYRKVYVIRLWQVFYFIALCTRCINVNSYVPNKFLDFDELLRYIFLYFLWKNDCWRLLHLTLHYKLCCEQEKYRKRYLCVCLLVACLGKVGIILFSRRLFNTLECIIT